MADDIFKKYPLEKIPMPTHFLPDKAERLFMLKFVGDCMTPEIKDQDILICKWVKNEEYIEFDDKIIIVSDGCDTKIRRLDFKNNKLTSNNEKPIDLEFKHRIVGVVKGIWSNGKI
jgi:phage repressor protein C with HTH and peptisase S24 domain